MRRPPDAATVIDDIVIQPPRFLPEFEHVSLTLVGPTRGFETLAAASELVAQFDGLQSKAPSASSWSASDSTRPRPSPTSWCLSSTQNQKLRLVAKDLVEHTERAARRDAGRSPASTEAHQPPRLPADGVPSAPAGNRWSGERGSRYKPWGPEPNLGRSGGGDAVVTASTWGR